MNNQSKDAIAWFFQTGFYTGMFLTMLAVTTVIVVKQTIFD